MEYSKVKEPRHEQADQQIVQSNQDNMIKEKDYEDNDLKKREKHDRCLLP